MEKVVELFIKGTTLREIEKITGINRKRASLYLKELGFEVKARSKGTTGMPKYPLNSKLFKVIDTEEKAYWLGFLYADGYIRRCGTVLEVTLKYSDKSQIQKFIDFLETKREIKLKKVKEDFYPHVTIGSKELCHDLISKGCMNNKSLILTFPDTSIVPKHLTHHFMRGYYDGDGTLCHPKPRPKNGEKIGQMYFGVIGTEVFLDEYSNILKKEANVSLTTYQPEGKAFTLQHQGNQVVKRITDFLYKDATIYLDRKYEILMNSPYKTS